MTAKAPEFFHMISYIPMNRFGTTENVSDLVLFLASERAAYITGEGVEISGSISL
jgi:3-oxoacyl-[acyl-carrier protein] reductase